MATSNSLKPAASNSNINLVLFAILLVAFVLRFWGASFGLPYLYHADEPIVVNHALVFGSGDLNPHFFKIPPLVSYLLFMCYGFYYAVGKGFMLFHSLRDFERLFFLDPSSFYLLARVLFGVILGTFSVYILFRLVKRFWNTETALMASLFLTTNFLHARDSHYIYADIPLLCVILAGFYVFFRVSETPRALKWHLLAGGIIGLATAFKYNGIFIAIPYLWICLCSKEILKIWKFWPVVALSAILTFLFLNPYAVLDHAFFIREIMTQSRSNSGGFPWFHHLFYSLAGAVGIPFLMLALIGCLQALFSPDSKLQSVGIFVLAYYAVLYRWGQSYDRYVLPLIPLLCILMANLFAVLDAKFSKHRILIFFLALLCVIPSLGKIIAWDRVMSAEDVRTVAKNWIESNVPAGSRLALEREFFMPRLNFSLKQLREKQKGLIANHPYRNAQIRRLDAFLARPDSRAYELYFMSLQPDVSGFLFAEPKIPYDLALLKQKKINYVLIIEPLYPKNDAFLRDLKNHAERVMSFSPFRDRISNVLYDPQALTGGPFLWKDICARERNGYPITLYKLKQV